jgi:hypothetical protein
MVVESKVVGGDDVDTGILLDLPVGETESLALGEELLLRELAAPVGLVGLLEVTKDANPPAKLKSIPNSTQSTMRVTVNMSENLRETENG